MKKLCAVTVFICFLLSSCGSQQLTTVCHKDVQSNFGQMSAIDDEGNIFYVCNDEINFLKKSGDVKTVVEGDDVTWITVSDYIYCVEENDTIVCYEKYTGEKLAEYEFSTDEILIKAFGNKLLVFSLEDKTNFIENNTYIAKYVKNNFEVKELSSGDANDHKIKNKFVSVNEFDNVYFYYEDMDVAASPGFGYDDVYFLKGNEYFGFKNCSSYLYYEYLPFFYDDSMYMCQAYWIFGPDLENDERLELPDDIHACEIIQCFQYGDVFYIVAKMYKQINFYTLDFNDRNFNKLSACENLSISTYIGHIDDTVYYADDNNDVYSCCISDNNVELLYKSTDDTDKHYEICGDKLFIRERKLFCENVEIIN